MSRFNNPDDQYRRPRLHFSDEKQTPQPHIENHQLLTGSAMLLGLALLMILAMIPLRTSDSAEAAQTSRDAGQTLQADCAVTQQMTYAPCGHQVTRRVALPAELAGKGRSELEAAYDAWQVTSFSPTAVSMERTLPLHCPQHLVLLPDEGGMLCVWQNRYGDALSLVKELGMAASELPDGAQAEARLGKGFDTLEALEKWLESAES